MSRIRVYWHISPEGAPALVAQLTQRLTDQRLPFHFKVLNDPSRFSRCAAAVLYLRCEDLEPASSALLQSYQEVSRWLCHGTPAFTKAVGTGVAVAEDPPGDDSFGLSRCHILADGIIRAHERGIVSLPERAAVVAERFADERISLETPYLNPGADDVYQFGSSITSIGNTPTEPEVRQIIRPTIDSPVADVSERDVSRCLEAAHRIAEHLSREALWHGDRCTWVAPTLRSSHDSQTAQNPSYETLGPTLYHGTSGANQARARWSRGGCRRS